MERSQRSGHCCPELCPHHSFTGNEPRTTVLYGNTSASITTDPPPHTHTFCRIPSLYILLFKAPQRMCVSIPSETGIVPHDSQNTSERERERERKTGPTLQPVTLGVIHTAHIWCTMAERPLPPKPF